MIYPLNWKEIPSTTQIGGKAKSLMETTRAGFLVPPGFILSVDFFETWNTYITSSDEWRRLLQSTSPETCAAVQEAARKLRFSPDQRAALEKQLADVPQNTCFAVRSSSPEEDLAIASFAGQYETILGVPIANLEESIAKAYRSIFDLRVFEYKRKKNLPVDRPRIALIVQRMVNSEVSGVAFSLNPNNNAFDEAVINASFGLGEMIVSGQVTPDTYIVNKVNETIIDKKVMHKSVALHLQEEGGTKEEKINNPEEQALPDDEILAVAALASGCEQHFGKPMDIEWAIAGGELFLLQARPITTCIPLFPEMLTQPGEPKKLYLDLIILTQGFFEPFSVLGMDIWSRMMDAAKMGSMPQGKDGYLLNVGGREYSIISNMAKGMGKRVFHLIQSYELPVREILKSIDLENEYGVPVVSEKIKQARKDTLKMGIILAPRMIAGLLNPQKQGVFFERCVEETFTWYTQNLLEEGDFDKIVRRGIEKFAAICKEYLRVAISGMLSMNSLKKMFANQGVDELIALLGTASPTNPTAQMGIKMLELASFEEIQHTSTADEFIARLSEGSYSDSFKAAYSSYIQRFGARGVREVDVATPRVHEDPGAFFLQLKSMDIHTNNVRTIKRRKEAAYQQLLELAGKMGKQKRFTAHVEKIQQLGYRESPKFLLAMMISQFRKKALALGSEFVSKKRLDEIYQVFDLAIDQVSLAEMNPALDLRALREANLAPRKMAVSIRDKDFPKIIDSRGRIFRYQRPNEEGDLVGEPISSGVVSGAAKVLATPYEKPVKNGEILVTRATEPSWTPVFIHAAGVVLEIGGPLQHGAIIAREYGIPCVSGIDEVTSLIKDGDLLEVDGTNGVVKILQRAQESYQAPQDQA